MADQEKVQGELSSGSRVLWEAKRSSNVEALIGIESGLVYRLSYDSEPWREMMYSAEHRVQMQRAMKAQIASMPAGQEPRDQMQRELNRRSNPAIAFLSKGWP